MTDAQGSAELEPMVGNIKGWLEMTGYKKVFLCSDDEESEKFMCKVFPEPSIPSKTIIGFLDITPD